MDRSTDDAAHLPEVVMGRIAELLSDIDVQSRPLLRLVGPLFAKVIAAHIRKLDVRGDVHMPHFRPDALDRLTVHSSATSSKHELGAIIRALMQRASIIIIDKEGCDLGMREFRAPRQLQRLDLPRVAAEELLATDGAVLPRLQSLRLRELVGPESIARLALSAPALEHLFVNRLLLAPPEPGAGHALPHCHQLGVSGPLIFNVPDEEAARDLLGATLPALSVLSVHDVMLGVPGLDDPLMPITLAEVLAHCHELQALHTSALPGADDGVPGIPGELPLLSYVGMTYADPGIIEALQLMIQVRHVTLVKADNDLFDRFDFRPAAMALKSLCMMLPPFAEGQLHSIALPAALLCSTCVNGDADGGNAALMWLRLLAAHASITNVLFFGPHLAPTDGAGAEQIAPPGADHDISRRLAWFLHPQPDVPGAAGAAGDEPGDEGAALLGAIAPILLDLIGGDGQQQQQQQQQQRRQVLLLQESPVLGQQLQERSGLQQEEEEVELLCKRWVVAAEPAGGGAVTGALRAPDEQLVLRIRSPASERGSLHRGSGDGALWGQAASARAMLQLTGFPCGGGYDPHGAAWDERQWQPLREFAARWQPQQEQL